MPYSDNRTVYDIIQRVKADLNVYKFHNDKIRSIESIALRIGTSQEQVIIALDLIKRGQ